MFRRRKADDPDHAGSPFFADWMQESASGRGHAVVEVLSDRRAHWAAGGLVVAALAATFLALPQGKAGADPSPSDWQRLRQCESSDNYSINTGNGYYGAYQFNLSTWKSVGGTGYPNLASPAEQDARALILYRERGWQPWTCATILGLKDDKDAGSGRIGDITVPTSGSTSSAAPSYQGGSRGYRYGDDNTAIKLFQNEMHARGYFPAGTGQFGPLTLAMVKRLQSLDGTAHPSGVIGPVTWALAWTGKYSTPPATTTPPPAPPKSTSPKYPAFPGKTAFTYGQNNTSIKTFQNEMHARGYFPAGTGQFGPLTLAMVKRLQSLNGLSVTGTIGPATWALAWTGKYSVPPTAPAFPTKTAFTYGQNNTSIKTFQNEMHARGYFPAGTGQFGPQTLAMVKRLQSLNGLSVTGIIGPATWALAWTGKYSNA
ncbi:peptidoglycan-binding protein [Jatrophihabitans sp.]|uniref:peptidoglycan-binding protein n=1 Tax=Jatrophihabitans sp. TaxID=1932789 RepID=UPI0030C6FC5E|nr:Peptidoglycan-binding domain of peptidoglycan hydrolase-containing protein [Jatrophihabitans sp.]